MQAIMTPAAAIGAKTIAWSPVPASLEAPFLLSVLLLALAAVLELLPLSVLSVLSVGSVGAGFTTFLKWAITCGCVFPSTKVVVAALASASSISPLWTSQ